jgi:capsid protein
MLMELYALDDLKTATIDKQKAAAAVSWIVEQASQMDINAVGSARTIGKTTSTDTNKKIVFQANGGSVQYTNPGDKFILAQSSDIGNNFIDLLRHELQAIAAGYGIPYYMLSGDTAELSFSAIRGILIEFRDRLEYIHNFINLPNGLMKLTKKFQDIAKFSYSVADATPTYQLPRSYGVDDLKDAQSDLLELQMGATTIERIQQERELTMEEVLASRLNMVANGLGDLLTPPNASSTTNGGQAANSNSSSN